MKTLGSFRGTIEQGGVNLSSGGFPQFVAKLKVEEMFEEETGEWAPFEDFFDDGDAEANDRTIFYFGVMFGKDGATRNNDQVKLITGWEGDSFKSLAAMDHAGTKIQWRNAENTYKEVTTVQVAWIDEYDATPGGSVKQIDDKAIADLDAKFAEFLDSKSAAPEKPKRGRKGKKDTAKAEAPKEETAPPAEEQKTEKPKRGRKPKAEKKEELPTSPADTSPPVEDSEPPADDDIPFEDNGPCTKQEAWNDVNAGKAADVDVKALTAVWQAKLKIIAPGKAAADVTDQDWSDVRAAVLDEVGA